MPAVEGNEWPMLEAQINQAQRMIDSSWAVMKDRNLSPQDNTSSTQITAWLESSERLISRMFGPDSKEVAHFKWLYEVKRSELLDHHHRKRKDPDWDIAYWIDYFELARSYLIELDAFYNDGKKQDIRKMEVVMGNKYETGQAGVVGEGNIVTGNTFQQVWQRMDACPDLDQLADELSRLRTAMREEASDPDDDLKVAAVASAEKAAREGDGPGALEAIKSAGDWALKIAEKIGVGVATAALKAALGL